MLPAEADSRSAPPHAPFLTPSRTHLIRVSLTSNSTQLVGHSSLRNALAADIVLSGVLPESIACGTYVEEK
jgi:hypothetical protein